MWGATVKSFPRPTLSNYTYTYVLLTNKIVYF